MRTLWLNGKVKVELMMRVGLLLKTVGHENVVYILLSFPSLELSE